MKGRRKRSAVDYVICVVGVLFICLYASLAFPPVSQDDAADATPSAEQQTQGKLAHKQKTKDKAGSKEDDKTEEPDLSDLSVTFIDVGQGDSELLRLPDDKVMLIDAGESSASDAVLDALTRAGVDGIDYLVDAHPHSDHIGGMEAVLDAHDVGEVWAPDAPGDTATYEGFLDAVDAKGVGIDTAVAGDTIVDGDAGYSVELLGPAEGVSSSDMNDYSAIVKVTYGDTSFLFTGDATAQEIMDADPGHVDVLKAARHGSETGTGGGGHGRAHARVRRHELRRGQLLRVSRPERARRGVGGGSGGVLHGRERRHHGGVRRSDGHRHHRTGRTDHGRSERRGEGATGSRSPGPGTG